MLRQLLGSIILNTAGRSRSSFHASEPTGAEPTGSIAALLVGRSYGWLWADPAMGVVGALVIARWSWGLIRDAGSVLLDAPAEGPQVRQEIEDILAATGDTLKDLHVWQIGPGHFAAIVSVASATPQPAQHYKALLLPVHELSHVTVEVQAL